MNQIRQFAGLTLPKGCHYTGTGLPVPSVPRAEAGLQEADVGGDRGRDPKTTFPKINLNQDLKKSEASQGDGFQDLEEPRVTKIEAPDISLTEEEYFEGAQPQVKDEAGSEPIEPPVKKCKQSSSQSDNLNSHSPKGEGKIVLQLRDLFQMMEPEHQVHSTSTDTINNNSNDVSGHQEIINGNSNDVSGHQDNETDVNSTEEVSVSKIKKKPAAKSPISVENVFARKIKEMKDIKKKEFEVMKNIDDLDRDMSESLKKKKEKIKELKAIQKQEKAVLNIASVENIFAKKIKELKDIKKQESEVMKSIDGLDREISELLKRNKEKLKDLKEIKKEERAILNA